MKETISFDRAADTYDSTRSLPPEIMSKVVDKLTMTFKSHDCKNLLDAGVGTGRFALPLGRSGFNVVGIDVSEKMLLEARRKDICNLFYGDLRALPFKSKKFDATLVVHVLHLIEEWKQALSELQRVTMKIMTSVALKYPPKLSIYEQYRKILLDTGWPRIHPGIGERDLINEAEPSKIEHIVKYTEERIADDILDILERKTYSFMWKIPNDLHNKIMKILREGYSGKRLSYEYDLDIYIWDVDNQKF